MRKILNLVGFYITYIGFFLMLLALGMLIFI